MKFFDKYYATLGLSPGVDDAQIKKAYRDLAKKYHPDRSGDPATREKFIEVNEAYEILLKRDEYIRYAIQRYKDARAGQPDRVRRSPDPQVRQRAASYAEMSFARFQRTPIYKTAVVVNSLFDYLMLAMGGIMVASPFYKYFYGPRFMADGTEIGFQYGPLLIGIPFLYSIWYFVFKLKES